MSVLFGSVKKVTDELTDQELIALHTLAQAGWSLRNHDLGPKVASLLDGDGRFQRHLLGALSTEIYQRIGPKIPTPDPKRVAAVREAMLSRQPDLAQNIQVGNKRPDKVRPRLILRCEEDEHGH